MGGPAVHSKTGAAAHGVAGTLNACALVLGAMFLAAAPTMARAQGGPPLVTDDPETPGDGHWEVNGAFAGERNGGLHLAIPDVDINYGFGDRIQLKLDLPLAAAHKPGGDWKTGLGGVQLGVKWRFVDGGESGLSVSTYPQLTQPWVGSAVRRDLAEGGRQFLLPVEAAFPVGNVRLDFEAGRAFVRGRPNQWVLGAILENACIPDSECLLELHRTSENEGSVLLVNVGLVHELNKSLKLLASVGREFGAIPIARNEFVFYLGVQVLR